MDPNETAEQGSLNSPLHGIGIERYSQLERITATIPDLIFIYDLAEGRNVYCNERVCSMLGMSTDTFLQPGLHRDNRYFHPDDLPSVQAWHQAMGNIGDHEVRQHEYRVRHANGSWRWLRVRMASYQRDSEGKLTQLICSASDITEQMETEQTLKQQTEILRLILDSMTEGVIVCDAGGKTLLVNRSAESMLKLSEPLTQLSQVRHAHADESVLSTEGFRHWHQHPLMRALNGETVSDYELSLYDRRRGLAIMLNHASAPLRDADGQVIGAVDVFRDVTESHRALKELQRAEEHFRLLVEGTTDYAIFMLDKDGCVVSWNPGAERILGYRKSEILGQPLSMFFTPEDQEKGEPQRKLKQTALDGRSEEDSWRVRKDGQRFWCTGVMGALHDAEGRVQGFVEIMRDNTERRLAEQNAFYLANHDPLTGLPNRARFMERLHEALINADRDNTHVALLLLDLDRFKIVNDSLGHHAGDQLLRLVALRLGKCVRETDTVARLGGDEFVLILTRLKSLSAAELVAENILRELSHPYAIDGQNVKNATSLGIAVYPQDGNEANELLQKADLAMYRAKAGGRNRFRVFAPSMLTEVQLRQNQEEHLRQSVEQGDFELVYQPQIDLQSLKLVGVEALLRSRNPGLMMLSPRSLISLAEDIGLVSELGAWVIRAACIQMIRWRESGMPDFKLAINVSASQLLAPDFIDLLQGMLKDTGVAPHWLEIEINESSLVLARENHSDVLFRLKSLGVIISIDDFGTGVSTLSFLKEFPVDVLKLDPALIRNLPRDHEDAAIVSAIIKLAKDLNIKVVAEGVETVEQLSFLRTTSCHRVQGYLFSEAVRPDKFEQLLQNRKREGQIFH